MYLTEQDLINLRLTMSGQMLESRIIKHLITTNEQDNKEMKEGVAYYEGNHKIKTRKITYYSGTRQIDDPSKTNNQLVHPFHRNLVDQKVDKILGDPVTLKSENEKLVADVEELLGERFPKKCQRLARGTSNKGVEWLHVFKDLNGDFKYVVTPAEGIIPIYDSRYGEELIELIRYYAVKVIENKKEENRWRVEWWNDKEVTYYMETSQGRYVRDLNEKINPRPHWYSYQADADGDIIPGTLESGSWERVPFIEFPNNDEKIPDIRLIKSLIDDYDYASSDLSNTLADVQDVIWKLKGYDGENLAAFMKDLKVFKAIALDVEGDATPESVDIPIDAREKHLKRLEHDVYNFGRGVNMNPDELPSNISGVALKFMFAWLDLKTKDLKSWMTLGLNELYDFAIDYLNSEGSNYENEEIETIYNESFIINEAELIENIIKSKDIVDDETLVAKHPWVTDLQGVLDKLEAQRQSEPKIDLGDDE